MKKWLIAVIGFILITLTTCYKPVEQFHLVTRVIDGDTIELSDRTSVRYIGINTPEKGISFYNEAKEANRKLVEGKRVRLEYDVEKIQSKGKGRGRTLAYVYVDGIFVNAWLVENGFAEVMTVEPNVKYEEMFRELERKAKKLRKGRWSKGFYE